MDNKEMQLREQICDVCHKMWQLGWVAANDGNVSAKLEDGTFLATPTGMSKSFITPEKLVHIDKTGKVLDALEGYRPSSEIKMHLRCYEEREDVGAVLHAHPPVATGFAVANIPLDDYSMIELQNHGALTVGADVITAYYRMETLELFAKISLNARLLGGAQELSRENIDRLISMRQSYRVTGRHPGYKKYSEKK